MEDQEILVDVHHENSDPKSSVVCCDPSRKFYRFFALFFMCFLNFGSYYCFDNPAALEDNIISDMDISSEQYGLLYSVYSWPNVIFPFLGGFLIDRLFGIRFGSVLFAFFIMLGQLIFAAGAFLNLFWLMILARVVFAVGGENLAVCQNNYAVKWFKGKELNTVFGIQLSFARAGSTVNLYAMKPLYNWVNSRMISTGYKALGIALLIGGISTILSLLCAFILWFMDVRNDNCLARLKREQEIESTTEEESIRIKDIAKFGASFWIICAICVSYYVAIFPFVGFGLMFFESKYSLDPYPWSEVCNSLIYFISMVASPVCGALVDYFGRNCFWIIASCFMTFVGHCMLAFTFWSPYIATSVMGVAYSLLAASLWPLVSFIVPERALGTAYGVMQSVQNLGQAVLFVTAGAVLDARGYLMLEMYFLAFLATLASSFALWFVDNRKFNGILNMTNEQRERALENQRKDQKND